MAKSKTGSTKATRSPKAKSRRPTLNAKTKKSASASSQTGKSVASKLSTKKTAKTKAAKRTSSTKRALLSQASTNHRQPPTSTEDDGYLPPKPVPKTRLTDQQLAEFRTLLLAKRLELVGDVDHLTREALHRGHSEAAGDLSSMPIHMADIGTDNWEQEFTLGLIDTERALLHEIDDALDRLTSRIYGVCIDTHKPITLARLRAKPWAKYCIKQARLHEQGRTG